MRLLLSTGGFSIARAGFFICYSTIIVLDADLFFIPNFDVPGHDFCHQSYPCFKCLPKCSKYQFSGFKKDLFNCIVLQYF